MLYESYYDATKPIFFTLTYAEDKIPFWNGYRVLQKRDVQLFLKRFRKRLNVKGIRYFICGEYGPNTLRPHYHGIFFNLPEDVINYEKIRELLEKSWNCGFVTFSVCNDRRMFYTAKYCLCTSDLPECIRENRLYKPFLLASKREGGIGRGFFKDPKNMEWQRQHLKPVIHKYGLTYAMPRYYRDKCFDDEMKNQLNDIRNEEWLAESNRIAAMSDKDYHNYKAQKIAAERNAIKMYKSKINKSHKI